LKPVRIDDYDNFNTVKEKLLILIEDIYKKFSSVQDNVYDFVAEEPIPQQIVTAIDSDLETTSQSAHATTHESGGLDPVNHDNLAGFVAGEHLDPAQVINVAKSGGDYSTIQAAIDSITDATTIKRYAVVVHPGVYTEAVTLKDYVDLVGTGRTNSIIAGTSGTVLTFPANKCTVSEMGINVDYGTLGANSTAVTSACADAVLKDCDVTVTKSGGDYLMNGMEITAGSFRMSDCYFVYSDTSAATATRNIQSAVVQTGTLTNVILNNNEMIVTTTDTNDDLVGFETTATVTGTCLLANNVIFVDAGAAGSSGTGVWAYGTASGAIFNQNRITVNCNASAYGFWIDSTAGGAVVDTRHNEIIVTAVGAAEGFDVATGDTLNSTFDKITAKTPFTGAGTITYASSPIDGAIETTGDVEVGGDVTIGDGGNVVLDTTTGTQIATAASQKLGFFGATPVVQQSEITDELTTITHTAPGTPDYAVQDLVDSGVGSAFGFATKDEGNTVLSVIANLQARVNELETVLVTLGFLADAD